MIEAVSSARLAESLGGAGGEAEKKLKEACSQFESLFLHQMFKSMRKTTMESDLVPKGRGEEIFTDMLDEELAKTSAEMGTGGLGDMLFEQMKKYLPQSDQGNNFHEEKNTDLKKQYNSGNYKIEDKKGTGINVAS
ncbi:rod-binding protein [Limisalsivibrio acetivorans]|uniref:rod-binding protein n=1 Tax=Limisalsivibrio acetivorans TaxID=1304888 RepID=UPI0003B304D8|nr:rod-binding protein [Limisalsivibrio acetivorans]